MRRLWRHHPYLLASFVLATALTLFFAGRLVRQSLYWSDPTHHEQQVQGWMTLGYVAKSWHLPVSQLEAALQQAPSKRPKPLSQIAKARGVPVAQVIAELDAAVAALRAQGAIK